MNRLICFAFVFCASLVLISCATSANQKPEGFLEGHLTIVATKPVELTEDGSPVIPAELYAQYPLVVLTVDAPKQVMQVIADKSGNYRVALPPGNYVLDALGRAPKRVRATPQPFTVTANQSIHIDMEIDTGIR